jgi:hypothetical protein
MNLEDQALCVLYQGVLDIARQTVALAHSFQSTRSEVAYPPDEAGNHADAQNHKPVIIKASQHRVAHVVLVTGGKLAAR